MNTPPPRFKTPAVPDSPALRERAMNEALRLAGEAAAAGEVPVGAVITCDGEIVGRGRNRREERKNALCHGELEAISDACTRLGGWRLHRCTLYVTLEPCPMCAAAAVSARIKKIVYGAPDEKGGGLGSLVDLGGLPHCHHPETEREEGPFAAGSAALLREFFSRLRSKRDGGATDPENAAGGESTGQAAGQPPLPCKKKESEGRQDIL